MKISLFLLLFSFSSLGARQANQYLQGQENTEYDLEKDETVLGDDPFLPGVSKSIYDDEPVVNHKKAIHQECLGTYEKKEKILSFSNKEILRPIQNKGQKLFSFGLHLDTYDWKDERGIYEEIFEKSTGRMRPGYLFLGMQKYLFRSGLNMTYGFNTGFSYSRGRASFTTGEPSETMLTLWQIPLELGLGLELPLGRFFKVFAEGGPAALALLQNRNDRDSGDSDKSVSQIGYGYFLKVKFGFSLSQIFSKYGHSLYSKYGVSNSYVNLELKTVDIGGFKEEEISLSGTSIGIGFSFEYL